MATRYELIEGTSKKFWEIELAGRAFTTRWGRIGAAGRNEKKQSFPDAAAAQKALDKLIAEKTRKGYKPVGASGSRKNGRATSAAGASAKPAPAGPKTNPKLEAMLADNPEDVATWQVYADWLLEQGEAWGEVIAIACAGKKPKKQQDAATAALLGGLDGSSIEWKYGAIQELVLCPEGKPDEESFAKGHAEYPMPVALGRVLAHPAGRLVRSLTLGLPPVVPGDTTWNFDAIIPRIAKAGPLPLLAVVDMTPDAEHMDQDSWRRLADLRPLWKAAPRLRELRMKGSRGSDSGKPVVLGEIVAPQLETLVYLSSGLDKSVPIDLGKSKLPALRDLALSFGHERYGNNCSVKSLAGILTGTGLPKLERLALTSSEWETELIEAVAKSKILPRLRHLDLSGGILCRDATAALVKHAARFRHLKSLDLSDNFLLPEHCKEIAKAISCAGIGFQREPDGEIDDEYSRYSSAHE